MKKKLLFAMAAITMLFATSCQDDLGIDTGNEALVSFNVTTPEMATRAENFGGGTKATNLQYAVYDENGEILHKLTKVDGRINVGTTTEVKLNLLTGDTYSIVFWAATPIADGQDAL